MTFIDIVTSIWKCRQKKMKSKYINCRVKLTVNVMESDNNASP